MSPSLQTALAAHRFGLGEPDLAVVGPDPLAWLRAQIGPADPQQGEALASTAEAMRARAETARKAARQGVAIPDAAAMAAHAKARAEMSPGKKKDDPNRVDAAAREAQRDIAAQDVYARLLTASQTRRPFAERLALFWINHFSVSGQAAKVRGLIGAFERDAIRPHIAGKFQDLLRASTLHPAMLRYLDNQRSVGPHSRAAMRQPPGDKKPRATGLNENLAREVLELHTLGAESSRPGTNGQVAYAQADVTEFARVLTGWTTADRADASAPVAFELNRHEPGDKHLLGKTYPAGQQALDMVLHDLSLHPATAHFLATKLARHFVADDPPPALVSRLATAYLDSQGELPAMYQALLASPQAWQPQLVKLKTPEEFAISSARMLRLDQRWLQPARDGQVSVMGQVLHEPPSPAGWPDKAEDWLGPDALWKRIEWSTGLVTRFGTALDARLLARDGMGPLLSAETGQQLARAADGAQALSLLLMSPEFQRR
ncbi:DUF1800 domain-containing protein [Ideonella azotifigens]|uniref:DUF1800 family protein n=1 Tax=Ideonella azotifigens TaxID=513160 RepID=A0ABN1KAH8_9BURK|nr:DUF1800 domain-containing protein [Ideonella azotifigens]MCD2338856.1 DUF1800 domain-containing protein [Ideonella azotifigens]